MVRQSAGIQKNGTHCNEFPADTRVCQHDRPMTRILNHLPVLFDVLYTPVEERSFQTEVAVFNRRRHAVTNRTEQLYLHVRTLFHKKDVVARW